MSDAAIRIENLSKRYVIGHQRDQKDGLRHRLEGSLRNSLRWLRLGRSTNGSAPNANPSPRSEEFWALKDISFEVEQGTVVGIIGRNGAGKSTLLKILSRITEPTSGTIRLKGRVASLLEVGTGFHQELTGRENIYLNGAILGMSRGEIKRKFDDIVAFSEVEKFLDTPVKRYSSGMYVRLAFAVAAHLETDILIVDEVLAVGDAEFQRKCLGKMQDVSTRGGRTVLFVSHNMAAIQRLCQKCALLSGGQLLKAGNTADTLSTYLRSTAEDATACLDSIQDRSGTGDVRFVTFHLEDLNGQKLHCVQTGTDFDAVFRFRCTKEHGSNRVNVGFSIHRTDETALSVFYSSYTGQLFNALPATGEFRCRLRRFPFKEGRYLLGARIEAEGAEADWPKVMIGTIDVVPGDFYGTGVKASVEGAAPVLLTGDWSMK